MANRRKQLQFQQHLIEKLYEKDTNHPLNIQLAKITKTKFEINDDFPDTTSKYL